MDFEVEKVMVKIEITNTAEFSEELQRKIAEAVSLHLERNIRSIAKTDAFDTGHFHASIHAVKDGWDKGIVQVEDGVEYGKYLEWGTMSHYVAPKNKKALHWKEGGKNYYSKGHQVRGIRPIACFQRGLNMTIKQLPDILKSIK